MSSTGPEDFNRIKQPEVGVGEVIKIANHMATESGCYVIPINLGGDGVEGEYRFKLQNYSAEEGQFIGEQDLIIFMEQLIENAAVEDIYVTVERNPNDSTPHIVVRLP